MSDATIPIGLSHSMTMLVDASLTVPAIARAFDFGDMPPVFATAFMVAFIEATCIEALKPHLARISARSAPMSMSATSPPRRSACG